MHEGVSHCFSLCFKSHFLGHTNVPIPNSQFQHPNQPNSKNEAKFCHSFDLGRYHTLLSCMVFTHETRNFVTPPLFDEVKPLWCICICVCSFDLICTEICAFDESYESSDNLGMLDVPCSEANI